jgi:uncharacterized membrane protein
LKSQSWMGWSSISTNSHRPYPIICSLRLNRRCITGCISYIPIIVTVNKIAECLRTDSSFLGDKIIKKNSQHKQQPHIPQTHRHALLLPLYT